MCWQPVVLYNDTSVNIIKYWGSFTWIQTIVWLWVWEVGWVCLKQTKQTLDSLTTMCIESKAYVWVRFRGYVFGRVGDCDCGSTKRICACVVMALVLLLNPDRRWGCSCYICDCRKVCSFAARGRHPLPRSLIISHHKSDSVLFVCALATTYCMGT